MQSLSVLGSEINDADFGRLSRFFQQASGIQLVASKKVLVCGRLSRRLRALKLTNYREYLDLIESPGQQAERQVAVDLLTTNETHFFREPKHFERLRQELSKLANRPGCPPIRVWSAASSTGEEPYSLAITMAEMLGWRAWQVFASDLSTRVLDEARRGIYNEQRAREIPPDLAQKYLLEGFDESAGQFRIDQAIRQRVTFAQVNLMEPLPTLEPFDVIFLRNVLIYFDKEAKKRIVESISQRLRKGGLLFIGHAETLSGITDVLKSVVPTVYMRP